MAEKRENSVLFSLRELRQIEDDRIKSEEQAARQREEDEKARVLAAERQKREEEERKIRAAEDAERARVEAKERLEREERLRLQEAEKRAQVDAQARLEEQRLKMEIDARAREASTKRAKILVAVSAAAFVLAVVGVVAAKWSKDREAAAAEQAALKAREAEVANKRVEDQQRQFEAKLAEIRQDDAQLAKVFEDINKSKSTEERQRLNEEAARIRQAKAEHEAQLQHLKEERAKAPVNTINCPPNDPLCGVPTK
jgi:hypothetical protein